MEQGHFSFTGMLVTDDELEFLARLRRKLEFFELDNRYEILALTSQDSLSHEP